MALIEKRAQMTADIAVIKENVNYIRLKLVKHVEEGEREGGFRDRLLVLEKEISVLKRELWAKIIVAGFIGGLVSNATPEAMQIITRLFIKP